MCFLLSDVQPFTELYILTHFSISAKCVRIWMFESKCSRAKHQNWMHPGMVRGELHIKGHAVLQVLTEKAWMTGKKKTHFPSSAISNTCFFFFCPLLCRPCFSVLHCFPLLSSALLRGHMHTQDGCTTKR